MARNNRMPACHWMLVAGLLAGCGFQHGSELGFRSAATDGKTFKTHVCCGMTVAPDRRGPASGLPRGVRERRRRWESSSGAETKQLTAQIKKADSASKLLAVLDKQVDGAVLDHIHVSAALVKLARFKKRRQLQQADASSAVLAKLSSRLLGMLQQNLLSPWSSANTLYAMGVLYEDLGECMAQALPRLYEAIRVKSDGMNAQGLSNCLWAAARLQDASPEVLNAVSALAKRIPDKVEDMVPQHLSNSLWAAAKLQDASPEVLDAVPALAKCIPDKVEEMKQQEWSNSLWAAARLQDASPEVLDAVPALANRIADKVEDMDPQALSNCLWAAAKLQDSASRVLDIVPALVRRMQETISAMNLQDLPNNFWAAAMLKDASPDFAGTGITAGAEHLCQRQEPGARRAADVAEGSPAAQGEQVGG